MTIVLEPIRPKKISAVMVKQIKAHVTRGE
jgi:hypothetical protein